ncbi:MAG: NAD(+)/NADH kinase [Clostridia bacterium]|nr:NAD(+)/NADH kinase [Clostridia bacterium]
MGLVVICPNPFRDIGLELTKKSIEILNAAGYETAVCPVFGGDEPGTIPGDIKTVKWGDVAEIASLFIIIGGDGTVLNTARSLDHASTPLLGVNLGTKGFMASLEPVNIEKILDAAAGNFVSSLRMMIDVQLIRDGEVIYSECALNDAVIHGMGDCIKLTAWCDGDRIVSFSGDGIVLATPTGSTGYSMSAGGPIVEPEAKNILVSPICAHVIGAKNFVLSSEHLISVKAEKIHDRHAYLSVDGDKGIEIINDDIVIVRKSEKFINLINMGTRSFYDQTFDKLLYKNI